MPKNGGPSFWTTPTPIPVSRTPSDILDNLYSDDFTEFRNSFYLYAAKYRFEENLHYWEIYLNYNQDNSVENFQKLGPIIKTLNIENLDATLMRVDALLKKYEPLNALSLAEEISLQVKDMLRGKLLAYFSSSISPSSPKAV